MCIHCLLMRPCFCVFCIALIFPVLLLTSGAESRHPDLYVTYLAITAHLRLSLCLIVLRCWKALRSWTTVCCSGCTTWTRRTGRDRWRAVRVAAMRRGPWPSRRPCTPQQWSPSKEELPAAGPSTPTTREFSQRHEGRLANELGDKRYCWHLEKGDVCLRWVISCYVGDNK